MSEVTDGWSILEKQKLSARALNCLRGKYWKGPISEMSSLKEVADLIQLDSEDRKRFMNCRALGRKTYNEIRQWALSVTLEDVTYKGATIKPWQPIFPTWVRFSRSRLVGRPLPFTEELIFVGEDRQPYRCPNYTHLRHLIDSGKLRKDTYYMIMFRPSPPSSVILQYKENQRDMVRNIRYFEIFPQ